MSAVYARIQLLIDQQRFEMARQELESLLQRSPNEALGHALLALCLSEEHQPRRALVHARMAVGLAPEKPYCYYILGLVQQELGQLKEARQSLQQALELDPEDPDFFTRLGLIALLESRWQEALNCAEQGLSLDPEHIDSQNLRSMALIRLGQPQSALLQLDQALLREPENGRVHANRGWTLLHGGQQAEAMEAFREALRLEPGLEWAREGMLEALKSRYWPYRLFQRYAFWMARFGRKHQFLIILGLLLVMQVLVLLAGQTSGLLAGALVLLHLGFVALTWLTDPFFNLLLLFHPFGRYVLAPHERRGARWFGSLLAGGLLGVVLSLLLSSPILLAASLAALGMLLPVAAVFVSHQAKIRRWLGFYSLGLAGLAITCLIGLQFGLPGIFGASLTFYLIGLIGSSWLANALMARV